MQSLKKRLIADAIGATLTFGGAALAAPVHAGTATGTDYSRFQIGPGVYPAYPPCLAWVETYGGGCGGMVYFDCEGLFGPPAPCDDPDFWIEWS